MFSGIQNVIIYVGTVLFREKFSPPPFLARRQFQGRRGGGGVYILNPPAAGILFTPTPLSYVPPTPRRAFSRVVGVGVNNLVDVSDIFNFFPVVGRGKGGGVRGGGQGGRFKKKKQRDGGGFFRGGGAGGGRVPGECL